ncbi:hypothetical protein Z951_27900 [Streptomyces sp. PRh5]|uniref:hypothetical protein n=1 Tax=Streptomyces sp. PRh5 TaxID=1158056 RepID=UPI00044FDC62|nr:hypothetical protein [Streptomyces sp. PRh5]EXU64994.1 hypothetical protein Z951_27900 [Streptomyces sp. PRh5]
MVLAATLDLWASLYAVVPLSLLVGGAVWQDTADRALAHSPRALLRADRRTVWTLPGTRAVAEPRRAATGRLPWRLMEFLEDACQRGALRQAGGVLSGVEEHRNGKLALSPSRARERFDLAFGRGGAFGSRVDH